MRVSSLLTAALTLAASTPSMPWLESTETEDVYEKLNIKSECDEENLSKAEMKRQRRNRRNAGLKRRPT